MRHQLMNLSLVVNRLTSPVSARIRAVVTGPTPNRPASVVPVAVTRALIWAAAVFSRAPSAVMPARWSRATGAIPLPSSASYGVMVNSRGWWVRAEFRVGQDEAWPSAFTQLAGDRVVARKLGL